MAICIVLIMAVLIAVGLYLMRSRAVLYRASSIPDGTGEPAFCVFNPFRDREPERSADAFLTSLKELRCTESVAKLPLTEDQRLYICEKEAEHVLESWRLENREDSLTKTRLFYWHWRKDYGESHERLWITVEKVSDKWQVTDFECWY